MHLGSVTILMTVVGEAHTFLQAVMSVRSRLTDAQPGGAPSFRSTFASSSLFTMSLGKRRSKQLTRLSACTMGYMSDARSSRLRHHLEANVQGTSILFD
jgi:hypothetical protein